MSPATLRLIALCAIIAGAYVQSRGDNAVAEKTEPYYPFREVDIQPSLPSDGKRSEDRLQYPAVKEYYKSPILVFVAVAIDKEGWVRQAELLRTTEPDFASDFLSAVKTWKVIPAQKGGTSVGCVTVLTLKVTFQFGARAVEIDRRATFAAPANPSSDQHSDKG